MIKPIEINEIPSINRGRYADEIEEFMNSNMEACEVFCDKNRSGESVYAMFWSAIKRNGYAVKVMRRKNRVFLINTHNQGGDRNG